MVFRCHWRTLCAPGINWLNVPALMKLCFPGRQKFEISIDENTVAGGRAPETDRGSGRMLGLGVFAVIAIEETFTLKWHVGRHQDIEVCSRF